MPKQHDLKIWPEFFADVVSGAKRYEVRSNDRSFDLDDVLVLREWNPESKEYTGQLCKARVIHIMRSTDTPVGFLLSPNVCVMGIEVFG